MSELAPGKATVDETRKHQASKKRAREFKRIMRSKPLGQTVTIDHILSQAGAASRFEELVNKGIPEYQLKDLLVTYANSSDKRKDLIPGMSRKQIKTLEEDILELSERIEHANKSSFVYPAFTTPLNPWPERSLAQIFLELPKYLIVYAVHIESWLSKPPRSLFDSDRQHLELASVAIALHFTGEPQYAAIAHLLTAALYATDEVFGNGVRHSKPVTRHALTQLVRHHPEDMELVKEQIATRLSPFDKASG